MSPGPEDAGYCVALAVDHDPWAAETHRHNIVGATRIVDLGSAGEVSALVAELRALPIGVVAAGPPCQPFSRAGRSKIRFLVRNGRREVLDGRAELWRSFVAVVRELRPVAALMENVPDMALGDDCVTVCRIIAELGDGGYDVHVRLVDAWRFGVPQHRQRLIVVCAARRAAVRLASGVREPRAFRAREWWSSDPLCTERVLDSADSLSLAACHACVLAPETACEQYNRFLDRAVLVGLPDAPGVGFSSRLAGK